MTYENLLSLSKDEFMRSKIVLSLKQLLLDSSLRKLTVTSICEHAGIARSSFYNL
jgi:AcrR family transcriptional regulator